MEKLFNAWGVALAENKIIADSTNAMRVRITNADSRLQTIEKSKTNYIDSEWEFPKGRRNRDETNLQCAKREFMEDLVQKELKESA